MKRPTLVLAFLAASLPGVAAAQMSLSAGVEYLDWRESTTPEITETGPIFALGLGYLQERDAGLLFAYRGKLWGGNVNYQGATLFGNVPLQGTTNYAGLDNELQVRWRKPSKPGYVDAVAGLGFDAWRRQLTAVQKEDYYVAYLRGGIESGTRGPTGWLAGFGLKYPLWTRENAHLDQIGFDSNPSLQPGKELSLYGDIGYRFSASWQLLAYYDSFRFSKSNEAQANEVANGLGPTTVFQPSSSLSIYGLKLEYFFH